MKYELTDGELGEAAMFDALQQTVAYLLALHMRRPDVDHLRTDVLVRRLVNPPPDGMTRYAVPRDQMADYERRFAICVGTIADMAREQLDRMPPDA